MIYGVLPERTSCNYVLPVLVYSKRSCHTDPFCYVLFGEFACLEMNAAASVSLKNTEKDFLIYWASKIASLR